MQIVKQCKDCGQAFTLTKGEQDWYAEHNYKLPERCPECRKQRRAQKGVLNNEQKK